MRFIHTADWHLGRLLHGTHLTEDQAYLLDQFVDLVKDERPDAVIIAGDIYDRSIPPSDAVKLFSDTLARIARGAKVPVLLISGNHDSPDRLHFGSDLLSAANVHVAGSCRYDRAPVPIQDEHGTVWVHLFPYATPAEMRDAADDGEIRTHDDVVAKQAGWAHQSQRIGDRSIAVAHIFASGGELADSERPLAVGGSDQVSTRHLEEFHYVALGHLHRRQRVGADHIRYSGSLMKYSFNEVNHEKSVHLVEMDGRGRCTVENVELTPRRDLRKISGSMEEILQGPEDPAGADDYIWVTLEEQGPVLDAMSRIREVYPNALHVERPRREVDSTLHKLEEEDRMKSDDEIFELFFEHVTGEEGLSDRQRTLLHDAIETASDDERSA